MLTPPWQQIPPLLYPEVHVCPILKFVLSSKLVRLMTVRYTIVFRPINLNPDMSIILSLSIVNNKAKHAGVIFVMTFIAVS